MIINNILVYLKYFISGNTDAIIKMNQLKSIYKSFKPSKYRFITREGIMTPLFVQKLFTLYKSLSVFKNLLESTLFSGDEKKSALYLNYYIESFLPDELKNKREKFLKELMLQKIMESENPTKMMKKIESEFNVFRNYFIRSNMPNVESEYLLLYRLNNLATFNFDLLFSRFDDEFDLLSQSPPKYRPVRGKEILNEIKDFYFLVASLPKKVNLSLSFQALLARTASSDHKKIVKDYQSAVDQIFKLILNEFSATILLNLARYIAEDPRLKIRLELKTFSILEKYRNDLEDRFVKNKDYVLEKYSEKSLQSEIKGLFKNRLLLPIDGYNDDIVEILHSKNINGISGIQGLKITKTFVFEIYEKRIKEVINILILEAFFNEKEYQKEFSDAFFKSNELIEFYIESEKSITDSGSNSLKTLQVLLASNNQNKIRMTVEILNEKILGCNKRCGEEFYHLGTRLYEVLKDFKLAKPERISNIHKIKGAQNKDFISKLALCYNDIAKYLKLIKNFVAIETSNQK